jgi:predicted unusual protein kinase regulating ubiquinone biosynthesis (AarF/ABC1/UbiB family)
MVEYIKIYKLCKYCSKMKNSLISNNIDDYTKYCAHLKYHIGGQVGNGTNQELDKLFDTLMNFISANKKTYNVENIKKKILEEKTQLKTKLEEYESQICELRKNKLILENTITGLEKQVLDKKNELNGTKNELNEAYSEDKIINKLKDLKKENIEEFINLLQKLFEKLYNKEVANTIIDKIYKDNSKSKREESVFLGYNYTRTWNEIIDTLKVINSNKSTKLINDIENYLDTGKGDVNNLISRYKFKLNELVKNYKK